MIKWFARSLTFHLHNRHQELVSIRAAVKESAEEKVEKMKFIIIRSIIKAVQNQIQGSDVCDIESQCFVVGWLVGWLVIYLLAYSFLCC